MVRIRVLAVCRKANRLEPEDSDCSCFARCAKKLLVQDPKAIDKAEG